MVSSCLLTRSMSSRSVMSCRTIEPYVRVKISAFCGAHMGAGKLHARQIVRKDLRWTTGSTFRA